MPPRPYAIVRTSDLASAAALLTQSDRSAAPLHVQPRPQPFTDFPAELGLDRRPLNLTAIPAGPAGRRLRALRRPGG